MANQTINQFFPDTVPHPGEFLEETLAERGMSPSDLAKLMGLPEHAVSGVIRGSASITPEFAANLERCLGISSKYWMSLEKYYRDFLVRQETKEPLVAKAS